MAQQNINLGTSANDGTGDSPRAGGGKINANFTELYTNDAAQAAAIAAQAAANTAQDAAIAAQAAALAANPLGKGVTAIGANSDKKRVEVTLQDTSKVFGNINALAELIPNNNPDTILLDRNTGGYTMGVPPNAADPIGTLLDAPVFVVDDTLVLSGAYSLTHYKSPAKPTFDISALTGYKLAEFGDFYAGIYCRIHVYVEGDIINVKYESDSYPGADTEIVVENEVVVATRVLAVADYDKYLRLEAASAQNIQLPPNADLPTPVVFNVTVEQKGAGQLTVVGGVGVTVLGKPKTAGQNEVIELIRVGTNLWNVIGGVA